MQEIKVATRQCVDERGVSHTFHYFLLVDEITAGSFTMEDYGVKIEEAGGESAEIRSLTPSQNRIGSFLTLLTDSLVTPVNLPEVVEDWL